MGNCNKNRKENRNEMKLQANYMEKNMDRVNGRSFPK